MTTNFGVSHLDDDFQLDDDLKKMRMIDCEAFQTRPSLTIFTQKIGGVAEPITAEAQT